jgi:hypothetical protein
MNCGSGDLKQGERAGTPGIELDAPSSEPDAPVRRFVAPAAPPPILSSRVAKQRACQSSIHDRQRTVLL